VAEDSRERAVPDVPTGPTEQQQPGTHPDAPDMSPDEAGEPAKGNRTTHPQERDPSAPDEAGRVSRGRLTGRAEEILPELDIEWRFDRGSDSGSPLAGLLAAAAASPQPLDARAYSRYLDSRDSGWPTVEELESLYGSFSAALEAAGIDVPDRKIT
jgi:hypothetical protein